MVTFDSYMENITSVAIAGHVRPDGDCVGSCLAVYNYLTGNYENVQIDLYLEPIPDKFQFLEHADKIQFPEESDLEYDLFIALDCGDLGRLGKASCYFEKAKSTVCVDHHISNTNFADFNYIFPHASSTCELVYELMDPEKMTKQIAECIYLGIVHDTGVFQYSCTSPKTMQVAGKLMEFGIDYPGIVDKTFFQKTYEQNRILGKALKKSELCMDGTCIYSVITKKEMEKYHVHPVDLDGIVSQLRSTEGVETAIFLYQNENDSYKVSMRSASFVDVAAIATEFGGGGHCRAAGATVSGKPEKILKKLLSRVKEQQKNHGECLCTTE